MSVQRGLGSRVGGRGFSLSEMVILIAVIAILAVIAVPMYTQTLQNYRLSGAAGAVVSEIRGLQSRAITEGGFYRLHSGSDPAAPVNNGFPGRYRIERSTDGGTTWNPTTGVWVNLSSDFREISLPITGFRDSAIPTPNTVHEIRFSSRGAVANTGVTYPIQITVSGPGQTRTVLVQRTGSVRVTSP